MGRGTESSRGGGGVREGVGVGVGRYTDEAGGRFDSVGRLGGGREVGTVASDSRRGGGSSGIVRGVKRGRSIDSDHRAGGGGDVGMSEGGVGGEGDPSQAFDSKRMRQPEQTTTEPEAGGLSRPSPVDGWGGRGGYGSAAGGDGGSSNSSGGRYREEIVGNKYGGGRLPMPMDPREMQHTERPSYDGRGSRSGRQGVAMDAVGVSGDRGGGGGGGGHRKSRGGRDPPEEDARVSRGDGGKKSRNGRERSSNTSRDEDGGGRKDKKKSKAKKRKP